MTSDDDQQLQSSKLGTVEYWNSCYEREVSNFTDHGDQGEIWFGEESADRMVRFLEREFEEGLLEDVKSINILDIGTGNGHLLFNLAEALSELSRPRSSKMLGIDYSSHSIDLCKRIASDEVNEGREDIEFQQIDFLNRKDIQSIAQLHPWHVACDKGTFDAIALSENGKEARAQYIRYLAEVLKVGNLFLITSCNFTEQELCEQFQQQFFTLHRVIPVPSFSFGGHTGSTTTTIAFLRNDDAVV